MSMSRQAPTESPITMMQPPRVPTPEDPAVKERLREATDVQRRARGRASTILTGGLGDTKTPELSKNILMGW